MPYREPHPAVIHFNDIKLTATRALKVARIMDVDYAIETDEMLRTFLLKQVSEIQSLCDVLEARLK